MPPGYLLSEYKMLNCKSLLKKRGTDTTFVYGYHCLKSQAIFVRIYEYAWIIC